MKHKIIKVIWKDACSKTLESDIINVLSSLKGEELLETNITYGKLLILLNDVVVITTEESTTKETEVTIIPRSWIIYPKELKK